MAEKSPAEELPPETFGRHSDGSPLGTTQRPRCSNCRRVLAEFVTAPWRIKCPKCRRWNGESAG